MTAGEHYRLKVCILAFIFDLHRSAYCMLWALFSVSFQLHSLPSPSSVGILASSAPLGETGTWLEFDVEKHLEVPPRGEVAARPVMCWSRVAIISLELHGRSLLIAILIYLLHHGLTLCINAQRGRFESLWLGQSSTFRMPWRDDRSLGT